MKRFVILTMLVTVSIILLILVLMPSPTPEPTIVYQTIERQLPVFRLASYQINYSGRIWKNGTDYIFSRIPTGGFQVRFNYDAIILIGTKQHPRVNLNLTDNVLTLDFNNVVLEVLAVTPTQLELVSANTSGVRWFRGGGIPIQDGLFGPFIEAISNAPSILNDDPTIHEKALESLVNSYKEFYSMLNYEMLILHNE